MSRWKDIWKPARPVILQIELLPDEVRIYAGRPGKKERPGKAFDSIAEVLAHFGKSQAYAIHVQGIGVLTRKVEAVQGFKDQLIVSGEKDDFYFTSWNDGQHIAVSFFRRTLLQSYLEPLLEAKVFLLGISCGPIPLFHLLGTDGEAAFDFNLKVREGRILDLSRNENSNTRGNCNGMFIERNQAMENAMLQSYKQPADAYQNGYTPEQSDLALQEYLQFSQFRFFGLLTVSIVLLLLVGNRMYVGQLNQQVAQLETDLSLSNENLALLDRLELEKKRKEQLISSSGANAPEFIAFYLDKIGQSVPKTINLVEMYVFPISEKLKQKQKVEIKQETIEIIGTTAGSEVLDDWIEYLNRFEWVKSVELINYLKIDGVRAEFKIIITLSA